MSLAALALTGIGLSTLGNLQETQNEIELAKLHNDEVQFQMKADRNIFNIVFPQIQAQQRAHIGQLASESAKGGVDVGSGSALTRISEQARINSLSNSLAIYKQQLKQRGFKVERQLNKRNKEQLQRSRFFTLASGGVEGATALKTI